MTTIALYPWETTETVTNEQIEAEILADAEFAQWLDEVYAEPDPATMTELEFLAYVADQAEAQNVEKTLSQAEQMLSLAMVQVLAPRTGGWSQALLAGEVEVLPDWQREDYVGS